MVNVTGQTTADCLQQPEAELEECGICFESLAQRAELPCSCRVAYCPSCWDRCLAQSYLTCSQARCPSCRQPVRVDYVAASEKLVFSREAALTEEVKRRGAEGRQHMVEARQRLLQQSMPTLIQNIQHFGAERPELAMSMAHGAGPLLEALKALGAGPSCVCGGELQRLTGEERFRHFMMQQVALAPGTDAFEDLVRATFQRIGRPGAHCDFCGEHIARGSCVWNCSAGNQTVFHTNALDVCERCLLRHACGAEVPAAVARALRACVAEPSA